VVNAVHVYYECHLAISNLLSNDVVLGNLLYSDVNLKLPKQLTE